MDTKRCSKCREHRPLQYFNRNSNGRGDGYQYHCKPCKALQVREWRQANRVARERGYAPKPGSGPKKLTVPDVLRIRRILGPAAWIAEEYGVSPQTVRNIRAYRTWGHV